MSGGLYLVTGASRGIGAATAVALAAPGRAVGINFRSSREAAEGVARRVADKGARPLLLPADASSPDAVEALFGSLPDLPLEAVVLNAGVPLRHARVHETAPEEFEAQWRAQALSGFLFCRRALPLMTKRRAGRLVFTLTSALEGAPPAFMAAYVSAKYALWGLAKAVEAEAGARGVTVSCLFPGMTDTDFIRGFPRPLVDAAREAAPGGRLATAEEVGAAAARLAEGR